MVKEIRICPCCGKEFIPCKKTQVMCSKSCVTKTRWKDPEYRSKKLKQLDDRWKDENYRKKVSIACSKSWTDEMRKKQSETQINMWKDEKIHEERSKTNKEIASKKEVKDKISKSVIETWKNADERKKKLIERRNCSSKQETDIYELLNNVFITVFRNYKSKEYPYYCDFYIPQLNLYIEYQGFATHGKHPFDNNNIKDIEVLNILKEKAKKSTFCEKIIYIWTKRDPLKRQTAKDNNLNWMEFFSIKEFMDWFNTIGETNNGQ